MPTVSNETVLAQLQWRYATKKFDPSKIIPPQTWAMLEEALVLTPSSYGLQPWKFFVIQDREIRKKLVPASWGQKQVEEASHLVVFCVKKIMGPADAERLIHRITEVRGTPAELLAPYLNMMTGSLTRQSTDAVQVWMTNQVFIALGQFLSSCALVGVDACPMEGFQHEKYDEILGLSEKGYHAVVVAPAGYRSDDDPAAQLKKVRFPKSEMIGYI